MAAYLWEVGTLLVLRTRSSPMENPLPNHPMQRTASQRASARCFAAADRKRWASWKDSRNA